jgi:multiple sugar transport system permease protein
MTCTYKEFPVFSNTQKRDGLPYIFISPALIFLFLFMAYPILNVFYYSLQNYSITKPYMNGFIGLKNFKNIFLNDETFRKSLIVSLKWVVIQVPLQLVVGMAVALILNKKFLCRGIIRALAFAPWAVSGVLTAMLWSLIFNENMGVLNDLLLKVHLISKRVAWVSTYGTAFGALSTAELWRGLPFFAIMILAGLQGISYDIYEAAAVDGTSSWMTFWYITLPQLKSTIILSTLLRIVWEFNNVDVIYNLTGGGPINSTNTLTMYLTQTAVRDSNFGYGSTIAVIAFTILSIAAGIYLKITGFTKNGD